MYISGRGLLFFTGFFGLSTLSTNICQLLHIHYLIELFFIPLFLYYRKERMKLPVKFSGKYLIFLFFILFSTCLGIIGTQDIFNVVTCIRAFVYFSFIIYVFVRGAVSFSLQDIYIMAFGALFGEFINKLVFMDGIANIDHINTFALILFVLIPFVLENTKAIFFSIVFGFFISFITLYRREVLVYGICVACGFFHYVREQKLFKRIALFITIILLGKLLSDNIFRVFSFFIRILGLDNTSDYTRSASYRLLEKFLSTDNASDAVRINTWSKVLKDFNNFLFPRGPVGKAYGLDYFGYYTDSTNVFMYDVFGSVLSLIIYGLVIFRMIISGFKYIIKKYTNPELILSVLVIPAFISCMLFDGTFMVHANISLLAGYAIHGWYRKD